MVHVEFVNVSDRGIRFPNERVRMVVAQPYLPLDSFTKNEPFQLEPSAKRHEIEVLKETLAVALLPHRDGLKTHFTIFPEYGIPGLDGIRVLEDILRSEQWPHGSVVVGGTDGLTRDHYEKLIQGKRTHVDENYNSLTHVSGDQWVNCAITWIKCIDGTVERWIQPKLHPAWEEATCTHQKMFSGRSIYIFKGQLENGTHVLFGILVCFDWIKPIYGKTPIQWILQTVQDKAGDGQLPLTWIFVIQRNQKPSHHTFISCIEPFFNQRAFPNVSRQNTCLVFANTAGKDIPGHTKEFGACSIVHSPQTLFRKPTAQPTFSNGGPQFRNGNDTLQVSSFKDFFFRERGACIHSFDQINPASLTPGAAGRSYAVDNAEVYPISGVPEPRAPKGPVAAATKWLHDALDQDCSRLSYYNSGLAAEIATSHARTVEALRALGSKDAEHAVKLSAQESRGDPDDWDERQMCGIRHVVDTLDIVGVASYMQNIGKDQVHAATTLAGKTIDVVAVCGPSHEDCVQHLRSMQLMNQRRHLLLVSRDQDNMRWHRRFASILELQGPPLSDDRKFTDPSADSFHIGYQNLLSVLQNANDMTDMAEGINAELAA